MHLVITPGPKVLGTCTCAAHELLVLIKSYMCSINCMDEMDSGSPNGGNQGQRH